MYARLFRLRRDSKFKMTRHSHKKWSSLCIALLLAAIPHLVPAQTRAYPDKIRGYKVERTVVEVKTSPGNNSQGDAQDGNGTGARTTVDQLITLGTPALARVTPLGITFELPVVVAPVTQSGKVDFLVFEDIQINHRSVDISEYDHQFQLPSKQPLTLKEPLRVYIYLPSALLAAIGEWNESKDNWSVTGRVYVFGKFKKGPFSFKRCVPVELNTTMRNPLRDK